MYTDTTIGKTVWSQISISTKMACEMRDPIALNNGLVVTVLNRGKKIRVTLNSMDTYDIELLKTTIHGLRLVESKNGIYCDQLSEVIYSICNK